MSYADDSIKDAKHSSQTVIGPGPLGKGTENTKGVQKFPQSSPNPMDMKNKRVKRRSVR